MMPMPAVFPVTPAKARPPSRPYGLTLLQRDTMLVLQELIALDGHPPQLRDIAKELCIAPNPGRVHQLLTALRRRGYVDWLPHMRRSIMIRVPLPFPPDWSDPRPPRIEILRLPAEAAE